MKPKLIILNGNIATGKTTLAQKISKEFNIPSLSMDEIKEKIYDHVKKTDTALWHKLSAASYDLMFLVTNKLLSYSKRLIIDSPMDPVANKMVIQKIIEKNNAELLQIELITNQNILWDRFQKRLPDVHFCHSDQAHKNMEYIKTKLKNTPSKKMDIKSEYMLIDTSDFKKINYDEIYNKINIFLNKK